jgi:hypothetical protein
MPLPKTSHPLFEMTMPSTGKNVLYRQMLVKDEKILLMAKASEDEADIYRAVKQVVNNCLIEVDVDSLTTFDIEYVFLKIRSISIGDQVSLSFRDMEDEEKYDFVVDLDDVEILYPEDADSVVKVSDEVSIKLRYPPAKLFDDAKAIKDTEEAYEWIASKCIETIFEGDDVYLAEDYNDEELLEYVLNLDTKSYSKVKKFIGSMPRLNYVIEYTNSKGTPRKISLTTLTDFFTLR